MRPQLSLLAALNLLLILVVTLWSLMRTGDSPASEASFELLERPVRAEAPALREATP